KLLSPVANPSKIIGAPINYDDHIAESIKDPGIAHGRTNIQKGIGDWGLFLKANSSLIGFGEEIRLRWPERRNDHEVELAVVIGELRQNSNTKFLVYNVERLIEFASAMYTLHPGDIIMTGTPAGVSPVKPGDVLHAYVEGVGGSDVRIAPAYA